MKKIGLFFAVLMISNMAFAEGSNGNVSAMDIYRCDLVDSTGHVHYQFVPRYYCENLGGNVIF